MNLNNKIKIELTPTGIAFYKNYWDNIVPNSCYPGLKENILSVPLWDFAQIFGQELYQGNSNLPCSMNFKIITNE